MKTLVKFAACIGLAAGLTFAATGANSQTAQPQPQPGQQDPANSTYTAQEIVDAGHRFFGKTTGGLAEMVEYVFQQKGRPNAYIVGEEAAASFVGGVRYGEGWIHPKTGGRQKIFWQGPSIGFDFGGNGSRTLVLVYNMYSIPQLYQRIPGVEGSAYVVGGLGVNFQQSGELLLAPIRTGVGARLGINIGYLKYTAQPTWNPF